MGIADTGRPAAALLTVEEGHRAAREPVLDLPPHGHRLGPDAPDDHGVERLTHVEDIDEFHGPPVSGAAGRLIVEVVLEHAVVLVGIAVDAFGPEKLVQALVQDVLLKAYIGTREE